MIAHLTAYKLYYTKYVIRRPSWQNFLEYSILVRVLCCMIALWTSLLCTLHLIIISSGGALWQANDRALRRTPCIRQDMSTGAVLNAYLKNEAQRCCIARNAKYKAVGKNTNRAIKVRGNQGRRNHGRIVFTWNITDYRGSLLWTRPKHSFREREKAYTRAYAVQSTSVRLFVSSIQHTVGKFLASPHYPSNLPFVLSFYHAIHTFASWWPNALMIMGYSLVPVMISWHILESILQS